MPANASSSATSRGACGCGAGEQRVVGGEQRQVQRDRLLAARVAAVRAAGQLGAVAVLDLEDPEPEPLPVVERELEVLDQRRLLLARARLGQPVAEELHQRLAVIDRQRARIGAPQQPDHARAPTRRGPAAAPTAGRRRRRSWCARRRSSATPPGRSRRRRRSARAARWPRRRTGTPRTGPARGRRGCPRGARAPRRASAAAVRDRDVLAAVRGGDERDVADRLEHGLDAERGVERGAQRVELAVDRVRGDLGRGAELVLALAPDRRDPLRVPGRGASTSSASATSPARSSSRELRRVLVLAAQPALEVRRRGVALGAQALHVAGLGARLLVELARAGGRAGRARRRAPWRPRARRRARRRRS